MNKNELIQRAKEAIQCVQAGGPAEDSFVEFKRAFPDVATPEAAAKTARQLAGQANAVAAEPFIWVIGVDEKTGVIHGADKKELSNWYSRVTKCFDGPPPAMASSAIVYDFGKPVTAILFEPSEPPYVVNACNSRDRVIPWREANGLRCANRSELLRLLQQHTLLPKFRVIEGSKKTCLIMHAKPKTKEWSARLHVTLYLENQAGKRIVMPAHDCVGWFEVPSLIERTSFQDFKLRVQNEPVSQAIIRDAEQVEVYAGIVNVIPEPREMPAIIELNLPIVGAMKPLVVRLDLPLRVQKQMTLSELQAERNRRVSYL